MNSVDLTENEIINRLFDFILQNFNKFECQGKNIDWWLKPSWSPFVETCFILWGEELIKRNKISNIGHSFTFPNITEFLKYFKKNPYDKNTKDPDMGFDVSQHDESCTILALEHEETSKGKHRGPSSTVINNLESIYEEIDKKLKFSPAKFKLITTRPRRSNRLETYPQAIENYRKEIENKLLSINPIQDEKWIVILIGPNNGLKPNEETDILFCNYEWDGSELISENNNKSFKVGMNENYEVRIK